MQKPDSMRSFALIASAAMKHHVMLAAIGQLAGIVSDTTLTLTDTLI